MRDIWLEKHLLDKERRELIIKLIQPYDEYFNNKKKEIILACEEQGHNFKFTGLGPLNHAWFHCTKCGLSKVENE